MKTAFTDAQLRDPATAESNHILRKCVHCGFCLSTCPTYRLSGNELESPRGRIWLIKEMLEQEQTPAPEVVHHIDQCLSCLSCATTCPSGVDYMHLVDHGRARIESRYRRPLPDRLLRRILAAVLPHPDRFRLLLQLGRLLGGLQPLLPARLRAAADLARSPGMAPARRRLQPVYPAPAPARGAVGLLPGCVQQATANDINQASIRVLNRCGYDVHVLTETGCCGAIEQHLGKTGRSRQRVARNVNLWHELITGENLEAVIVNASGCGTMLKDYGHVLAGDPELAARAQAVSGLSCDISEFLQRQDHLPTPVRPPRRLRVACHNPCSLQHGQGITEAPARLLSDCGFDLQAVRDGHLCCGSAGTYNLLHPDIAGRLGRSKAAALEESRPDVIATGNLGCLIQIGAYTGIPVVHTVQLLDWAGGGPDPLPR